MFFVLPRPHHWYDLFVTCVHISLDSHDTKYLGVTKLRVPMTQWPSQYKLIGCRGIKSITLIRVDDMRMYNAPPRSLLGTPDISSQVYRTLQYMNSLLSVILICTAPQYSDKCWSNLLLKCHIFLIGITRTEFTISPARSSMHIGRFWKFDPTWPLVDLSLIFP